MMEKICEYIITGYDTDYFHVVSPSSYVKIAQTASYQAAEQAGIRIWRMYEELDTTWMTASVHMEIFRDVRTVGPMEVYADELAVNGVLLTQRVYIFRDGTLTVQADINTMAVNYKTRKVVPPAVVMEHFGVSSRQGAGVPPRLNLPEEMELADKHRIRYYDCDHNRHLRASHYTDYLCDVSGYWSGERPKGARRLDIEYLGECHVGDELSLYVAQGPEGTYVQGVRSDGHPSFKAYFVVEE